MTRFRLKRAGRDEGNRRSTHVPWQTLAIDRRRRCCTAVVPITRNRHDFHTINTRVFSCMYV